MINNPPLLRISSRSVINEANQRDTCIGQISMQTYAVNLWILAIYDQDHIGNDMYKQFSIPAVHISSIDCTNS